MIGPSGTVRVMLATRPVDFRKGMDGLAMLVREQLGADPFCGTVFAFRSKRADRLKLLFFDGTGVVLVAKRLEAGAFRWPKPGDGALRLTAAEMAALVDGLDWRRVHVPRDVAVPRLGRANPRTSPALHGAEACDASFGDLSMDDLAKSQARFFTAAARAAAAEVRRLKRENPIPVDTPKVFVIRVPPTNKGFGWEIRRFGSIVLSRSAEKFDTAAEARAAGEAILKAELDGLPPD